MDKIARELEWRYDDFQSIWTADTPIGNYQAWEIAGHGCYRPPGWVPTNVDGGLSGAKAAAQAYFEKLVRAVVSPYFEAANEITALRQQLAEARAMRANAWIIEVDDGVMIARQGNISVTVAAETATVNVSESDAPAVKLRLDEFFPDKIQFAIASARALSASRGVSTLTHETDTKPHTSKNT